MTEFEEDRYQTGQIDLPRLNFLLLSCAIVCIKAAESAVLTAVC